MATIVTPVSGNHCIGQFATGEADYRFRCVSSHDDDGNPVYSCTTKQMFNAQCLNGINRRCSSTSRAFVAAITVCIQRLFV